MSIKINLQTDEDLVTILIATKNRADCVERLVNSIRQQNYKNLEIIVVDDASEPAITRSLNDVKLLRNNVSLGACFARNRGLEISTGNFIIIFDDDTELIDPKAISRAVTLAQSNPDVGAIAFHQLRPDGIPHEVQAADVDCLSYIVTPAFFGCLLRKEALLKLGTGFIEEFNYYYEEIEFTLRLLDVGYKVIYDPELRVVHYVDWRGRNWKMIRRLWARNAMLTTFLRYPWWTIVPAIVSTVITFLRMKDDTAKTDWTGIVWIFSSLVKLTPFALANRRPIKSQTLKLFKQLRRQPMPV